MERSGLWWGKLFIEHLHRCGKLPCVAKHSTIIISNEELALLASREHLKCNCLPLSRRDNLLESLLVGSPSPRIRAQHGGKELGIRGRNKAKREKLPEAGNSSKNWG